MSQRFTTTIYFQLLAALSCVATALIATWATSSLVIPALRDFNIRAYGLEPPIEIASISPETVKRPWAPVSITTAVPDLPPPSLSDLFPPQYPNAPLPNQSAKANELEVNLFYSLMYYGHPVQEYAGKRLTLEFDAATGYGRVATDPWEMIHEDYLAYAAALELHHVLQPAIGLFNAEREKVRALAPAILSTVPTPQTITSTPRTPSTEPYWLARQLFDLTGDEAFRTFADEYGVGLVRQGTNYANLVQDGRPRTLYSSHFMLPAVMHDMAQRTSDPETQRKAGELMAACIAELYDPISRTIYNDYGSISGPGSDTRESNDLFDAIMGLWRYYDLTGDDASQRLALSLCQALAPSVNPDEISPMMDLNLDIYRLYAVKNEQGTMLQGGHISSALNLRALYAIQQLNEQTGFGPHDQDFALLLSLYDQKFYDEIHNGFAWEYTYDASNQSYSPVRRSGHLLLSIRLASRLAYLILNDQYARAQALQGGN